MSNLDYQQSIEEIGNRIPSLVELKSYIAQKLGDRKEKLVPPDRRKMLRKTPSAVLFNLIVPKAYMDGPGNGNILNHVYMVLEQRSKKMNNNPGDMAFPGGKADPGDKDLFHTAKREALEEIGLECDRNELLGYMDEYVSSSGLIVRGVISWVQIDDLPLDNFREELEKRYGPKTGESSNTVAVPLSHVLNPEHYSSIPYNLDGGRTGFIRYININEFLPGTRIWGLTASMIRRFADIMFPENILPQE